MPTTGNCTTRCTITFRQGSDTEQYVGDATSLSHGRQRPALIAALGNLPVGHRLSPHNQASLMAVVSMWDRGLRPGLEGAQRFARHGHVFLSASDDGLTPIFEIGWLTITFEEI